MTNKRYRFGIYLTMDKKYISSLKCSYKCSYRLISPIIKWNNVGKHLHNAFVWNP